MIRGLKRLGYTAVMHADLEKLEKTGKITSSLAKKLDQLSPGRYCHHKEWGTGKVVKWSLPKKALMIDFEAKPKHVMALDLAFKSLTLLTENHFLVQRYEKLESLKKMSKDNPVELIRVTLEGNNNQLKPEELEKNLKGSVIPAKDWKQWWDNVRAKLYSEVEFSMPTRKGEFIRLRREKISYSQAVIDDYGNHRDLKDKVRVVDSAKMDNMLQDVEGCLTLVKLLDHDVRIAGSAALQQGLELAVIRDNIIEALSHKIGGDNDNVRSAEIASKPLAELLQENQAALPEVIGSIAAVHQKNIYNRFPVAFGANWMEEALRVFDKGGTRAVGEVAKFIKEQKQSKLLLEHLHQEVINQTLQADGLIWICRNRTGEAKKIFGLEVGFAILALIDQDYMNDGPTRAQRLKNLVMEDGDLVRDFIKGVALGEVRQFAKTLYGSAAFPELDRKALVARMMSIYPELQDIILKSTDNDEVRGRRQTLFVSWESLNKRKEEYEELVNVKIPQNKHNKSVFRAEGDLRENAGYQDAKEVERVLNRRRAELEHDLEVAQGTDFKGADTSVVSMGTIVSLQPESGDPVDYTILGAWDSDPERHVVSYLSQAGAQLIGHKVGDEVAFVPINEERKRKFTVLGIKAVNP